MNTIVYAGSLITSANLAQYWRPSYTLASTGVAEPAPGTWLPDNVLNKYFVKSVAIPPTAPYQFGA